MPADPNDQPSHVRAARIQLDDALDALCQVDPLAYYERRALVGRLDYGARQWQSEPIRLPRGVSLNEDTDGAGETFYTIHWGPRPLLDAVPIYDRALAVATVWTVFALRRPWDIDDARLQALVDHPPIPPANIMVDLLSIRFSVWIHDALRVMTRLTAKALPTAALQNEASDVIDTFAALDTFYESRAITTLHELSCTLDVLEPESSLYYELRRWRWMLYDYSKALAPAFHVQIERLGYRFGCGLLGLDTTTKAWDAVCERRILDACMAVVLTRAAMLDTSHQPDAMIRFVDPLAKQAVGSFAWWCHWMLEAVDEDHHIGDRLKPDELGTYTRMAMQQLDAELLDELLQAFPSLRG